MNIVNVCQCCGLRWTLEDVTTIVEEKNQLIRDNAALRAEVNALRNTSAPEPPQNPAQIFYKAPKERGSAKPDVASEG